MKWNRKHYHAGDSRIKEKFLFFPKSLPKENGEWETRWLEKAAWREEKVFESIDSWVSENWIDKKCS